MIPTFNAEKTIALCLKSIFESDFKDFEVIVIDDVSNDKTTEIVTNFPCRLIKLDKNQGASQAREAGRINAKYEIVVFIDSDVTVFHDTLTKLTQLFTENPGVTAITGLLSKTHPNKNFFSQYKNLYMNYIFTKCPENIDFLFGSFFALRNIQLDIRKTKTRIAEDSELGFLLYSQGKKIILDKKLEVIHLKHYSFLSLLKNDFFVPFYFAKLFVRQKGLNKLVRKKRFSHTRFSQVLSILTSWLILLSLLIHWTITLVFLLAFLIVNLDFFVFLLRNRGILFVLKSSLFTWFDQLVMGSGIIAGFINEVVFSYLKANRVKKILI